MNHDLALFLEMGEQTPERLIFGLTFLNRSDVKLLLPYPEVHGLRFGNKGTMKESEWGAYCCQSTTWAGFELSPGENKAIEYHVRPSSIENPKDDGTAYYRWCVDLPSGDYLVWFAFRVGEDYFCPDSHYRIKELRREAERSHAEVWMGETKSNRIQVVHTEREPPTDL